MIHQRKIKAYHRVAAELSNYVPCGAEIGNGCPRWVPVAWGTAPGRRILVAEIIASCALFAEISLPAMLSHRRPVAISRPRQAAMYLACVHTDRTLPDIGARCGGRDHTTVMHAWKRVQADLDAGGEIFGPIIAHVERELGVA